MVRREIALGAVVCGCIMVDMENKENEMIVDVRLRQSEMNVLLRLRMTQVQVVDEIATMEKL